MSRPDTTSPRARVALGSLFQISARLGAMFLGLVLMAYLSRRLGVAEYGQYAVAVVVVGWLSITISVATGGATVRLVAGQADGHRYAATMLQTVAALGSAIGLLVAAFAQPIADSFQSQDLAHLLRILSAELFLGSLAGVYSGILVAQGRFALSGILQLARSAAQLGAAVLLVERGWLAAGACAAIVAGSAVQVCIGRAVSGIRVLSRDRVGFAHLWGHTRLLAGGQIALRVAQTMDLLAVKFFTGSAGPAGLYAGASSTSVAAVTLFSPSSVIVLQSMAQSRREGRPQEAARTGEIFVHVALNYGVLLCALSVLADDITLLLLGPAFAESAPVLAVLLWTVAFRILALAGRTLIAAVGESASIVAPLVLLIGLGAAGYAVAVPSGGILAAARVALTVGAGTALASLREGLRLMSVTFPWRSLRRMVTAGVGAALVAHALPGTGLALFGRLAAACMAYATILLALNEWQPDRKQITALLAAIRRT